jgi:hypothetical protein
VVDDPQYDVQRELAHAPRKAEELPPDATLLTPLSRKPFRITGVQEHRILTEYREDEGTVPLQREQFETLYDRISEGWEGFDLGRLPPDAEPYATVLSLHPMRSSLIA